MCDGKSSANCSLSINLTSSPTGLSIEWANKSLKSFMLISKVATKGEVFPTSIPSRIFSSLLQKFSSSKSHPQSYVVACDSGEVILVLLGKTGNFTKICQIQGTVVWANFINDYFVLLESCGKLSVGNSKKHLHINPTAGLDLQWRSVTLPVIPICCSAIENFLVLSDGYSSFLYEIQTNKLQELTDKLQRLSLCGVIDIKNATSQIRFSTCDGRNYIRPLQILQEDAQKNLHDQDIQSVSIPELDLEGAMKAIKRFSDMTNKEKVALEKVNTYLEQISLAQTLITDTPKEVFSTNLLITPSPAQEGYTISLTLKRLSANIRFRGPWWRLNVKLKSYSLSCGYSDFQHLNSSNLTGEAFEVSMLVPLDFVEKLVRNCNEVVNLEFYLTFSHFSLKKPLCVIKIHKEPVDVLHFLTPIKNCVLPPLFTVPFDAKISNTFQIPPEMPSIFTRQENSSELSYYKTYFLLREKHVPLIQKIFKEITSQHNQTLTITRWLQNISLNLSCEKTQEIFYKVTIESSSREVVVAVRSAIERRALTNYNLQEENENTLELPLALYRKAHVTKVILNIETSESHHWEDAQKNIYESVVDLISSTPL